MSCVLLSKILFAATRNRMIAQNESDFQLAGWIQPHQFTGGATK